MLIISALLISGCGLRIGVVSSQVLKRGVLFEFSNVVSRFNHYFSGSQLFFFFDFIIKIEVVVDADCKFPFT